MSDANDTRRPLKVEIDVEFEGYSGREHHVDALLYPKGLLLRTRYLKPVGTLAEFEIYVVEGEEPLRGRGPVVFSRWQDQGPRRPAGLGLRIDHWEGDSAARSAQWFDEPAQVDLPEPEEAADSASAPAFPPRGDSAARLAEIEASLRPVTSSAGPSVGDAKRARDRSDLDALAGAVVEAAPAPAPVVPSNPWIPPTEKPFVPTGGSNWEISPIAATTPTPPVSEPPFRAVWATVDSSAESSVASPSATPTPSQPFRPVWAPPDEIQPVPAALQEPTPAIYSSAAAAPEAYDPPFESSFGKPASVLTEEGVDLGYGEPVPAAIPPPERHAGSAPAFRPTVAGVKPAFDDVPMGPDGDVVWAPPSKGRFLPWIGLGLLVGALIAGGYWVYQTRFAPQPPIISQVAPATAPAPAQTPAPAPTPTLPVSPAVVSPPTPATTPPATVEPAGPAASAARFRGVREIRIDRDANGLAVVIELDGLVQSKDFSHFRLDGPPREVIRLTGVERPFERGKIAVGDGLLTSVRTGAQPGNALQIVLDLGRSTVRAEAPAIDGSRIILRLRG